MKIGVREGNLFVDGWTGGIENRSEDHLPLP